MHDSDSAEHAVHLVRRTALAEGVHTMSARPVLHGDNGATLKATTVLAMLHWLGIKPSYSRPRVSDDNAYAEALFRTAKYRPEFPLKGFADLDAARQWAARFVQWYNHEHRHSGIRYVTPAQRHAGLDGRMLAARHALYQDARTTQPATLERADPQLDTGWRRHAQSGAQHRRPGGNIANPAFRFDRTACFPVPTWQCPSHGAQRRRWEERSHPQPRAARPVAREHGEAGEHRTFSAVSTVAHSSPVGGSHRRTSTPQAQRFRREEELLRGLSGNYLDTHRRGQPEAGDGRSKRTGLDILAPAVARVGVAGRTGYGNVCRCFAWVQGKTRGRRYPRRLKAPNSDHGCWVCADRGRTLIAQRAPHRTERADSRTSHTPCGRTATQCDFELQRPSPCPQVNSSIRRRELHGPHLNSSGMARRQPPKSDPLEEQARFECMMLIKEGALDNWTVFIQRESGAPWSAIIATAPSKQRQAD